MTDRIEWTLNGYASAIANADVAIAPLLNTPSARGKCAYKMLQYAAIGLPTVSSPVGANAVAAVRLGAETADTSAEWIDALDGYDQRLPGSAIGEGQCRSQIRS